MSVIMLSNMSSSILNSSPTSPGVGGEIEALEDFFIEELPDSGTLFAEILETASASSDITDSIANMSESDCDDDMLNFLAEKNFVRTSATCTRPTTGSCSGKSSSQDSGCSQDAGCSSRRDYKKTPRLDKDIKGMRNNLKKREAKKEACMNKSAIQARMNREKKKRYIDELEGMVDLLESENKGLTSQLSDRNGQIDRLKHEVHYLKSVIANHTSLSSLLSHIPFTNGMQFGSSICSELEKNATSVHQTDTNDNSRKKRVREDNSEPNEAHITKSSDGEEVFVVTRAPKMRAVEPVPSSPKENAPPVDSSPTTAGVCLHVSNNKVSLEFCASCAGNAASALQAVTDETESDRENANVLKAG